MTLRQFVVRGVGRVVYPVLPRRYQLPLTYLLRGLEGSLEPEMRQIDSICRGRNVAIDVGANQGLFSYRLASLFKKVYAFEINSSVVADLAAYNPGNIEIIEAGLSSTSRDETLYIPVLNGLPLTGWASLAPGNCPDTREHITKAVRVERLDSYDLEDVSFIKIDVEGHELEVLRGARETIERTRPVLLVEMKDDNASAVAGFLSEVGYAEASLQELSGAVGSAENKIFLPRELPDSDGFDSMT